MPDEVDDVVDGAALEDAEDELDPDLDSLVDDEDEDYAPDPAFKDDDSE